MLQHLAISRCSHAKKPEKCAKTSKYVFFHVFPPWRKSWNWVVLHFPTKPFWTIELESHGVRFNRKWCAVQLVHNSVELVPVLRFVQPWAEKIRVRLLQHVCAVCTTPYVCCESPHFFFNLLSRFLPWKSCTFLVGSWIFLSPAPATNLWCCIPKSTVSKSQNHLKSSLAQTFRRDARSPWYPITLS